MSLEIPVTIEKFREMMEYSRDVVEKFIKSGMPIIQPGGKGAKRTILISKALVWMESETLKQQETKTK